MGQTWGVYPCIGTRFIGEKSVIFWPNSMIFLPNSMKFCMKCQEVIIYRFCVKIYGFGANLLIFNFSGWFWQALKGLGPQNPTKKLAHWEDLLDHFLFRNRIFKIFRPALHLYISCTSLEPCFPIKGRWLCGHQSLSIFLLTV